MMVVTWPCLMDIKGPYDLARWVRERWGLSPRSKRLPKIGRGFGPGGRRPRWPRVLLRK